MFNENSFNNSEFNWVTLLGTTTTQDTIVYNGYGFQNSEIITSNISSDNGHSVDSDTFNKPFIDLGGELSYFFRQKVITLNGFIKTDTEEELNNKIDELKKILGQNNKDLDIKVNGTIRRAKASCTNLDGLFDRNNYHLTFLPFSIQFRLVSEFAKETTRQAYEILGQTASFTDEITYTGSIRTYPTLSFLLNSATTVTSITFEMGDNTIVVTDTYSASDVIVIDCKEKTVTINSIEVDFTGTFPVIEVGVNSFTVTIDGTKNFDLNISYFNNYL